jgi:hypothetical protein
MAPTTRSTTTLKNAADVAADKKTVWELKADLDAFKVVVSAKEEEMEKAAKAHDTLISKVKGLKEKEGKARLAEAVADTAVEDLRLRLTSEGEKYKAIEANPSVDRIAARLKFSDTISALLSKKTFVKAFEARKKRCAAEMISIKVEGEAYSKMMEFCDKYREFYSLRSEMVEKERKLTTAFNDAIENAATF